MSVVAGIRALLAQGFTIEQALAAAEAFEPKKEARSAAAERQARYRARKKERTEQESVTRNVTRDVTEASRNVTRDQKEMSPTPPIRKTTSSLRSDVDPPPPSGVAPVVEKQKRASRLPANWTLPESYREAARQRGIADEEIDRQAARMLNWSLSSKAGAKLDWFRTWLNWIDDCPRQAPRGSPQNVTPIRRGGAAYLLMDALEEQRREREKDLNSQAFEQLPFLRAE